MRNLLQAVWVERLKARRSLMPLVTAVGFAMIPLVGGFFMVVLKDPELARRMGFITLKARLTMGAADWPTYLQFLTLAMGAGGTVLFGMITTWVFGREYADRTLKDVLALPTSRLEIVLSKFVVIAGWSVTLVLITCLITLAVGAALDLPPVSLQFFGQNAVTIIVAVCLTLLLVTPIALAASVWQGYLPPIGVLFLVMALAQFTIAAGWGEYFPWAIPIMYVQGDALGAVNYAIVVLTGLIGLAGTCLWWQLADQTH